MANEKWTTVHPIPWRDTSFTYLPYWLFDIIVEANKKGEDWRDYSEDKYKLEFDTLKDAFTQYHDVHVIESRNGRLVSLLSLTPVTISAKTPPAFKVGDPDLAPSALFTFDPAKSAENAVLTVDDSGHAEVTPFGFIHAVSAGDVVVTATIGDVTEDVTLTVAAA